MMGNVDERRVLTIPPFRDGHMHFLIDGRPIAEDRLGNIGDCYLRNGIFAVCDMGHKSGIGLEAKRIFGAALEVQSAGYALYRRGTYGSFLGRPVSGKEELRDAVDEIAASGADFLKIINSGMVDIRGVGLVTEGGFSTEELVALIEAAREHHLSVICHANSDRAIRAAVDAGVASIEHGFFISPETLHVMAEKKVSWVPTIIALLSLSAASAPAEKKNIEKIIESHLQSITYAASIGVVLRVGTDSGSKGVSHGASFFDELQLLQKAGLALEQILSAACMGKEEVEKGNYLVVKEDFITARRIETIFKEGKEL